MKLQFTQSAMKDLERLKAFLEEKNKAAAKRYSEQLKKQILGLQEHPKMGKPIEDLPHVRELVARDYVVRYLEAGDMLTILRVWHSRELRY